MHDGTGQDKCNIILSIGLTKTLPYSNIQVELGRQRPIVHPYCITKPLHYVQIASDMVETEDVILHQSLDSSLCDLSFLR